MKRITRRDVLKMAASGVALAALPSGMHASGTDKSPAPSGASLARLEKGQLIVFDGDSMTNRRSEKSADTWPYLRLMNWDKVWPEIMSELLFCWRPDLALSFFNAGSGGSTCRGLARRLESNVLARKPQWVITSVAGNDARVKVPHAEFRETMTTYAKRITRETGAQVLFFGVSEHGPDYPKDSTIAARKGFYDILSGIATEIEGVHYTDIGPALATKARLLQEQDGIHTIYGDNGHFNAVGHMIVAGEILRYFGVVNC